VRNIVAARWGDHFTNEEAAMSSFDPIRFVGWNRYPERRLSHPPASFAWICVVQIAAILALIFA
jgi:hypothetical protein